MRPDYTKENERRKKAVNRENDFIKDNLLDEVGEDDNPVEDIPAENQNTQTERDRHDR